MQARAGRSGFILIVEDDRGANSLIAERLGGLGLQLRSAYSGREALELLLKERPRLLLLDYALPDMGGEALLAELEKRGGGRPPHVVITGFGGRDLAVSAMKAGALDFLVKDASFLDTLPARAANALEKADLLDDLEAEREKYRAMFESLGEAVFVHKILPGGERSNFYEVNDLACERLGYSREELLKLGPADINPAGAGAQRAGITEQLLQRGKAVFEIVHITKDGRSLPVEATARAFEHRGERFVISIVRLRKGGAQ